MTWWNVASLVEWFLLWQYLFFAHLPWSVWLVSLQLLSFGNQNDDLQSNPSTGLAAFDLSISIGSEKPMGSNLFTAARLFNHSKKIRGQTDAEDKLYCPNLFYSDSDHVVWFCFYDLRFDLLFAQEFVITFKVYESCLLEHKKVGTYIIKYPYK